MLPCVAACFSDPARVGPGTSADDGTGTSSEPPGTTSGRLGTSDGGRDTTEGDTAGGASGDGSTVGADGSCTPDLVAAPVTALASDVIVALDPAWPAPVGVTAISDALQSVEATWIADDVQLAIVSQPLLFQPRHDPSCDSCGVACPHVSVHAWYEQTEPPDLEVTEALRFFDGSGSLDCVERSAGESTTQYLLFASRDPEREAGAYATFAATVAQPQRTRFHLGHAGDCFGTAGGLSFQGTTIDSGGLTMDLCEGNLVDFLERVGRRRWACAWDDDDLADLDLVRAVHEVGDEDVDIVRATDDECPQGGETLEFRRDGDQVVLCSVACDWLQSIPVEEYSLQQGVGCG